MSTRRTLSAGYAWHVPALVGLLLLAATGVAQNALRGAASGATALVEPPPQFWGVAIDPRILRRLLGVRVLVADLVWIDALFKSDTTHEREPFTKFYRAFKAVTALDPDNIYAYYVAGLYLSVIKDDIQGATAILREGVAYMESHPYVWRDAWQLPFTLGYNLMFEEHELEEGSVWIRKAAAFERAPEYAKELARRVATEQGQLEVGARILADLHRRVSRPDEKARVEAKMLELAARQDLLELNERFERFLRSTGAYAFSKRKQLQLFLKSISHSGKDMAGRPLVIGPRGKFE